MKVLVAIDNSAVWQEAIKLLCDRPWQDNTEFLVVNVMEPTSMEFTTLYTTYSTTYSQMVSERLNCAKKLVQEKSDYIKEKVPGAKVEKLVLEGPAGDCLIEKAKEWSADFIILSSNGHHNKHHLAIGNVAEMVMSASPCSVEVIKPSN